MINLLLLLYLRYNIRPVFSNDTAWLLREPYTPRHPTSALVPTYTAPREGEYGAGCDVTPRHLIVDTTKQTLPGADHYCITVVHPKTHRRR